MLLLKLYMCEKEEEMAKYLLKNNNNNLFIGTIYTTSNSFWRSSIDVAWGTVLSEIVNLDTVSHDSF